MKCGSSFLVPNTNNITRSSCTKSEPYMKLNDFELYYIASEERMDKNLSHDA